MRRTLAWFAFAVLVTAVGWAQAPPATWRLPLSIPFDFANN
jgi:hypothetical protein